MLSADEIIKNLEEKYKDDADTLEEIERAKQNIEYIRSQKDYKGQTPEQFAKMFADSLDFLS